MRWRWAYRFERRETPTDLMELTVTFQACGFHLKNPGTGRITLLSPEGDQIESSEPELAALLRRDTAVRFQWWIDDCLDVFCSIERLPNNVTRHSLELGLLNEENLNRFADALVASVGRSVAFNESVGAVIEPLHYGDFDADEWTAFFLNSDRLPTWPQILIGNEDRMKTIQGVPAPYVESKDGEWRVLRYPTFLPHPLRAADVNV